MSVGHDVGVSKVPLLDLSSTQVVERNLHVVGLDVSSLWLGNLAVDPEEDSIPLAACAG